MGFLGRSIRLMLKDGDGDILPDQPGGIEYSLRGEVSRRPRQVSIKKDDPNSIRLMTYNTISDGLLKPGQFAAISKIIKAIQPEIMVFQEIYDHDAKAALQQIETIFPSTGLQPWYSMKGGRDVVIVSRYPIDTCVSIDGNGAFLIDLNPKIGSKLLLIGAHLPCCENNEGRRNEIDALMRFIRKSKHGDGGIRFAKNTPIILLGDLNLVGEARQLNTLLDGSIQDTMRFGPRFAPDWDGSSFADLMPLCTGISFSFTYFDRHSSFSPGRLDFMIYSDSVIQPVKKFVLFTPTMPPDSLAAYNLTADDAPGASDHLPVVADFILMND